MPATGPAGQRRYPPVWRSARPSVHSGGRDVDTHSEFRVRIGRADVALHLDATGTFGDPLRQADMHFAHGLRLHRREIRERA